VQLLQNAMVVVCVLDAAAVLHCMVLVYVQGEFIFLSSL